ncbi:MAG TPA: Gfo/Idh/MocA family oxidoreductase [Puia sp.]|nr:Gfo/Idh/MocA family oxidoreductase [Puia sp.]
MNSDCKFGIVGCGRIAQRHAEHIQNSGILLAVCDTDINKAKALGEKYKAKWFNSLEAMLASCPEIDVVSVCTPNGLHAEHSITALKAGRHVLCEKPMALTVPDCSEMINAAERANKRLFIVKQNRFNPPVEAVKKLIDSGGLGKIYSVQLNCFWNRNEDYYKNSWKGTKDLDGGTLYTQFSHFIDLLYWFVGDIEMVMAVTDNFHHKGLIEFEDTGMVILKFLNGAIGTINYTVNAFKKNMEGSLTIFAEKGTVKIGGQYLNELEYQSLEGESISDLPPGNPPNNYGQYFGSMSNHDKVYQNLISVLKGNGTIATSGMEGLKTVEIIEKIYQQAKKNKS